MIPTKNEEEIMEFDGVGDGVIKVYLVENLRNPPHWPTFPLSGNKKLLKEGENIHL